MNAYGSGCYNCGGWSTAAQVAAGVGVVAVTGAAVASANAAATANAYNAGAAANTANAYNAGVVAGSTGATVMPATFAMGAIYAAIPAGCITPQVQGGTYYLCGNTWFQPSYGANGVYYRVVPGP